MKELRAGPGLRLARGLVTATVSGGIGLAAHAAAGGLLPSAPWLILIYLALAAVTIGSMGGPAGLFRLVALVGGGQFATHLMLTALAGHAGDHSPPVASSAYRPEPVADMGSRRRGPFYDLTVGPVEPTAGRDFPLPHWVKHLLDDLTGPHAAMALAHVAAAVVVAWWLAQGESALWTILLLLGATVVRALTRLTSAYRSTILLARASITRSAADRQRPPRPLAPLTGGLGRRGPPMVVI